MWLLLSRLHLMSLCMSLQGSWYASCAICCLFSYISIFQMNKGVPSYLGSLLTKIWKRFWECHFRLWEAISKISRLFSSSVHLISGNLLIWKGAPCSLHLNCFCWKISHILFLLFDSNSMKELSPHIASVMNILERHASYLMSGKELSKLVAFVKGTQFDLVVRLLSFIALTNLIVQSRLSSIYAVTYAGISTTRKARVCSSGEFCFCTRTDWTKGSGQYITKFMIYYA